MKQISLQNITLIIVIVLAGTIVYFNFTGKSAQLSQEATLPDLIINSISYKVLSSSRDSLNMPLVGSDRNFEFTIEIKNIGEATLSDALYILNTRSNLDFTNDHYSHTQIVNQQNRKLNPGDTLKVVVSDSVNTDINKIRFLIGTDGKTGQKSVPLPKIEEKSYQNNSYELQIK